jgi:hypothetical protein
MSIRIEREMGYDVYTYFYLGNKLNVDESEYEKYGEDALWKVDVLDDIAFRLTSLLGDGEEDEWSVNYLYSSYEKNVCFIVYKMCNAGNIGSKIGSESTFWDKSNISPPSEEEILKVEKLLGLSVEKSTQLFMSYNEG